MFSVSWVAHGQAGESVEHERNILYDLDKVVKSCQRRLVWMRAKYPSAPPDGFIVLDQKGAEVRRWFDSTATSV
jgi:hypothetical protein